MIKAGYKKFNHLLKRISLLSAELLITGSLFMISMVVFSYLVKEVIINQKQQFDEQVFNALKPYITKSNTAVMQAITFFATHNFLIPANLILTAYFLWIKKHKWYSIKIAVIALSSTLLMLLMKQYFNRARPLIPVLEKAKGLSFPSGHAMMSFSFYGLLIYLLHKYIKNNAVRWPLIIFFLLFILLIGFSRVYLRVHYASDVIAGYAVGIVWLVIAVHSLNKIEKYYAGQRKLTTTIDYE